MTVAPEPILRAGLETVRWALVCCRNWTLRDDCPTRQVNDLMEAIHEVPAMLMHWEGHDLEEIKTHLGCFPAADWRRVTNGSDVGVPDLAAWFEQKLTEMDDPS